MTEPEKLERGLNLLEATSLNMTFMIGIGPFVVIPFIIRAMNGPQCILAWVVGAALALVDGCVWAELGAAMPQAGGTYVFLREAYGPNRFGRLMSFLFIWQTLFQGPLSISSGALGFADYSLYLTAKIAAANAWLGAHPRQLMFALANYNRLVAILLIAIAIVLLYRRITAIGKISTILWIIAAATIAWLIYGGATHFNKDLVFTYPAGAWSFSWIFFAGLGHASVQAIYSYLGYYNVCNLGGEMKNPERNIPRAIFLSIFGIAALYFALQTCILAVVPWQEAQKSPYVVSLIRRTHLRPALGLARHRADSRHRLRFRLFRHAGLFACALRRRPRRQFLFNLRPRASHQALPQRLAHRPRPRLDFRLYLHRPLFRHTFHPGDALPHPICGPGSRLDEAAPPMERGPLALSHVALSRASVPFDRRLDRNFYFYRAPSDARLARSDARRNSRLLHARPPAPPMAIRGGRLMGCSESLRGCLRRLRAATRKTSAFRKSPRCHAVTPAIFARAL